MSITDEIKLMVAEFGGAITVEQGLEACRDAKKWPALHERIWAANLDELAMEARRMRFTQALIRIERVPDDSEPVRQFIHIRGTPGFQTLEHIVVNPDLASAKLAQLQEKIARVRNDARAFAALISAEQASRIDRHLSSAQEAAEPTKRQRRPKAA